MDVSDLHGPNLNLMAEAIENSYCVLICATDKYRESPNCQAEALHAFRLNKPIVGLILDGGFEISRGWLGVVLEENKVADFSAMAITSSHRHIVSPQFNECIEKLKLQIEALLFKSKRGDKINEENKNNKERRESKVESNKLLVSDNNKPRRGSNVTAAVALWGESEVDAWFGTNNIDKTIREKLVPCNGQILRQLYDMKQTAPEFYFKSLAENSSVDLKAILIFTNFLEKLFR